MKKIGLIGGILSVAALAFIGKAQLPNPTQKMNTQNILNADTASLDIELTPFEGIELKNHCDVEVLDATAFKATISDQPDALKYLKLEVVNGKLVIGNAPKSPNIRNTKAKAVVYMPAKMLKSLSLMGSGNISLKNEFGQLNQLSISGSGNIKADVASTNQQLNASISGSGDMDLLKMEANDINGSISGSGNMRVNAKKSLNASISGSGNIMYRGHAKVTSQIAGSGEISQLK